MPPTEPTRWGPSDALKGAYLTPYGLERLKEYKFTAGDYTALDRWFNVGWNWALKLTPVWVAPNTLTLLGFLCSLGTFVIVALHIADFRSAAPAHVYVLAALFAFGYQTFDALDGKQARRTGTSSTLGTLFDHGCDIITSTLLISAALMVCRMGDGRAAYWTLAFGVQFTQFLYLWWEKHFSVFISNPGYGSGVTEAQCCFMGLCLATALFGADFWLVDLLPFLPVGLRAFVVKHVTPRFRANQIFAGTVVLNNILANMTILARGFRKLKGSPWHACRAAAQIATFVAFQWSFWLVWKHGRMVGLSGVFLALFSALTYGIVAIRLLLASTSQRSYSVVQWPAVPAIALGFACEAGELLRPICDPRWFASRCTFAIVFSFELYYLCALVRRAIVDMCKMLDIYCFSITKKPKRKSA